MTDRTTTRLIAALLCTGLTACSPEPAEESRSVVLGFDELSWQALNPLRGDKSPQAATLWGDRNGLAPTGFLVRFVDGFSSPPHIHNVSYRAVVIDGLIHNDDPAADKQWMSPGSFWTQPAGGNHITAARGERNIAFVEIDAGPYLVRPSAEATTNEEQPLNIDASNLVWLKTSSGLADIAYLWGEFEASAANGSFIRVAAGDAISVHTTASVFHAVVIEGQPDYGSDAPRTLAPGSYFGSEARASHRIASSATEQTVVYIHTDAPYRIVAR